MGEVLRKFNHIIKQPYNKSENHVTLEGDRESISLRKINFLKARVLPVLVSKQA